MITKIDVCNTAQEGKHVKKKHSRTFLRLQPCMSSAYHRTKKYDKKITMKKKENENGPNLATHIQEKDEPCGNWSNKNKKIIISVELLPNRSRGCHENIHDCLSFFCGSFFSKSLSIPFINTQSQSGKKKINSLLCCTFLPVVSPQGCNPSA